MVIEIKEDIFLGNDFKGVNTLIQICSYKNRYTLLADISKIVDSGLYQRLDNDDRDMLNHNFNSYILSETSDLTGSTEMLGNPRFSVTYLSEGNSAFNIEESIAFFAQRVAIVLENSLNDSYFIEAIVNHFDNAGKVRLGIDNDWIAFDNMGGCPNLKNFIESKISSYKRLPKEAHHYLRCFVLLDSDRTNPTLSINYKYTAVEAILQKYNIPYHITEKRNMENYMPDEVFKSLYPVANQKWAEARSYLNEKQKDFLDISGGFSKKGSNNIPLERRSELNEEVQELYKDVSDANFEILDESLGMSSFKTNFPKMFVESPFVHKNSLLQRTSKQDDPEELKHILDKIYSLI